MQTWGVFLPVYAIRSARDWGAGDFTDLGNLIDWTQNQGGGIVGTLPLLAAYLDKPLEPSPYSPASRLFWNELYIDARQTAEYFAAHGVVQSPGFITERDELRACRVDYKRVAALKRRVLEVMARDFFANPSKPAASLQRFKAAHPRVEDYARFRAVGEKRRESWWTWPERLRNGVIEAGDYDEAARRYHLYVQWLADAQVSALAERAGKRGPGLYLDLPLGVNPDGYDVWRERDSFAVGASAGRRPIRFSRSVRNGASRRCTLRICASGYRYLRDVLKNHFQYAGVLRIDHLMGLHRSYLGAAGLRRHEGRLRPLSVGRVVRGLLPGIEPQQVRVGRRRPGHGAAGGAAGDGASQHSSPLSRSIRDEAGLERSLYVGARRFGGQSQLARSADVRRLLERCGHSGSAKSGIDRRGGRGARARPSPSFARSGVGKAAPRGTHRPRCGSEMGIAGVSDAHGEYGEPLFVMTNLEDLWLSTKPQNRPGTTWTQQPNWQTKAAHPLEELDELPGLRETLRALNEAVQSRR